MTPNPDKPEEAWLWQAAPRYAGVQGSLSGAGSAAESSGGAEPVPIAIKLIAAGESLPVPNVREAPIEQKTPIYGRTEGTSHGT